MTVAPSSSGLTWEDFLNLPDEPRYRHAELIDGELVYKFGPPPDGELTSVNSPVWLHQQVVGTVYALIWNWIRAGAGRGSVTMEPPVPIRSKRGYLPDVAWFREQRSRPAPGNAYLSGAPDLAVEVLSPSTRAFDLLRKRVDYARVGCASCG
jgi:Uma2 family endonuclease